ncbi:helix-turn-helix transcriptional regulator [Microbulbifer sp. ZKSA004]|uniref:helix-turn-helix transcriptional regulator n=1 Tax=Microbulbifer sp. ZKSA004 TaxID=3243389 RepID=UPI00403A22C3
MKSIEYSSYERLSKLTATEIVVECQHCGDLFEIQTLLVPPGKSIELSLSPFLNLIIMDTGYAKVTSRNSPFELLKGQVWLAGSGHSCKLSNTSSGQHAVIVAVGIRETMLNRFCKRYNHSLHSEKHRITVEKPMFPEGSTPIIFPNCHLTDLTLSSFKLVKQLGDNQLSALKLEELLLLKLSSTHGQILAGELLDRANPEIHSFKRYMEENATKCWTVAMYAENIGMCLTLFRRKFRLVFNGISPKLWLIEQRLRHADFKLRTTNMRLVDIAEESGFSSQSYFTQTYKAKYGFTPTEAKQIAQKA